MEKVYIVNRDNGYGGQELIEIFPDQAEATLFVETLYGGPFPPRLTVAEWPLAPKVADLYLYQARLTLPKNTCHISGPQLLGHSIIQRSSFLLCVSASAFELFTFGRSREEAQANVLALRDRWEAAGRPCPEGSGYQKLDL